MECIFYFLFDSFLYIRIVYCDYVYPHYPLYSSLPFPLNPFFVPSTPVATPLEKMIPSPPENIVINSLVEVSWPPSLSRMESWRF